MKKKLKCLRVFIFILALTFIMPYNTILAITIDSDNEYTLYIDDYPGDITNTIYAKFKTSKKDYEDYALSLIEDDEDVFSQAIQNLKIDLEEENIALGFTTVLIYTDPESGDDKKKTDAVTVLCPLPDDAQEYPDYCYFYQMNGSKASLIASQRVKDEEGIIYEKFDLPTYGMYGFVYRNPDSIDEDEENEDSDDEDDENDEDDEDGDNNDSTYTGNNHDPIEPEDDSRFEYTEDDDEDEDDAGFEYTEDDDFDDDFSSDDDSAIEEFDSDAEDDDDNEPYYYEKDDDDYYIENNSQNNAETENEDSSSGNVSEDSDNTGSDSYSSNSHVLDNTGSTEYNFDSTTRSNTSYTGAVPKTGDDFPLAETVGAGIISLVILAATIILIKRKR